MSTSLNRKLERCAREIAEEKSRATAPRYGLTQPNVAPEQMLPAGVWESAPGVFKATCRSCENDYELFGTPEEFHEDGNYCGGSPRCLP